MAEAQARIDGLNALLQDMEEVSAGFDDWGATHHVGAGSVRIPRTLLELEEIIDGNMQWSGLLIRSGIRVERWWGSYCAIPG